MKPPSILENNPEWIIVGPMGPELPEHLCSHPILAIDGGAHHAPRIDIWVGDSDSFTAEVKCDHVYRHPQQKSQSDLSLALELFSDAVQYKFHLWGFLGGRRDHEIFNLGEALTFLCTHPESHMDLYDQDGKVRFYLMGPGQWKFQHRGLFSLGCIRKVIVRLEGQCDYPILHDTSLLPLSSFGLSNVGHGEMTLYNDGPVFIYFPELEK